MRTEPRRAAALPLHIVKPAEPAPGHGGPIADTSFPLLPEGSYSAVAVGAKHVTIFKRPMMFVWFQLLDEGVQGVRLFASFRLPPHGHMRPSSRYYRAWTLATGRKPIRGDRLSPRVFLRRAFRVMVRTVRTDRQQRPLTPQNYYSIIDTILAAETGGPTLP